MSEETIPVDPVFSRICESTTRLTAGLVNRSTMKELQGAVAASPAEYPWEAVVDRILREPLDTTEVTKKALRAQRDWVVRGGRETPGKSVGYHAKSFVARMMARCIFMLIFIPMVVIVLVLVKQKWPELDIYRILHWLQDTWPTVFPR